MTQPGIPNEYTLSTSCYGTRLRTIEDQAFAAVAMGFRRLEIGLSDAPVPLNGFEDSRRETGITVRSLVAGCMSSRSEQGTGTRLGSLDIDSRERALNCVRSHIRLALDHGCPVVVLSGCEIEDEKTAAQAGVLQDRLDQGPIDEELQAEVHDFVHNLQKKGHRQVEQLCRSMHTLLAEFPDIQLAIEPAVQLHDILSHEAVGWVLDDLDRPEVGYWHDTGRVHLREKSGLAPQGKWLDDFAPRLMGCHLQDATESDPELPPGSGEVDFKLVSNYLPADAERVVNIHFRHGRGEILGAVQFLLDIGI